jgi:hypothetical protein
MISLACDLRWLPWMLGCHVLSHHHFYSPFLSIARGCLFRHQLTSSHFTFVEVSIFLVFYFQIWDLWESNNYLKLDRSPLSSSISFHCAYICSPVAITSLNLLINFKFCLFYSHSHYTSLLLLIWTLLTQMVSLHFYQILKVSLKSSTSWKSHLNQ